MTALMVSTHTARGVPAGGVVEIDGWRVTRRDATPTTGMCMVNGIPAMARWTREGPTRIDVGEASVVVPAADCHDIGWDGEHLVVVSTATNEVLWCTLSGTVVRRWCPDPAPDSWHLSGLSLMGGTVVSAFGRYGTERGWAGDTDYRDAAGLLLDVDAGEEIVSGLRAPHSPVWADGWWWCESRTGTVRGPAGPVTVGGWTRGLAVTDDLVFVGVSPFHDDGGRSRVVVLDRATLEKAGEVTVGDADIFAVLPVEET